MSGSRISDTLPALHQASAAICAANGLTIHQVAAAIGLSVGYTKNILGHARRLGLVDCIQTARREVKWYSPKKAAAILKRQKAASAAGREERRRVAKLRDQAKRRGHDASDWHWRELAATPTRSKALADAPLPFACSAPNSVFALGATS